MPDVGLKLSKKRRSHFFEKAPLRSAPLLSADSGQFDAHSAQSVFCHAHVAAENVSYLFRVCGRETLRGFFDILKPPSGAMPDGGFIFYLCSISMPHDLKAALYLIAARKAARRFSAPRADMPGSGCSSPAKNSSASFASFASCVLLNASFSTGYSSYINGKEQELQNSSCSLLSCRCLAAISSSAYSCSCERPRTSCGA